MKLYRLPRVIRCKRHIIADCCEPSIGVGLISFRRIHNSIRHLPALFVRLSAVVPLRIMQMRTLLGRRCRKRVFDPERRIYMQDVSSSQYLICTTQQRAICRDDDAEICGRKCKWFIKYLRDCTKQISRKPENVSWIFIEISGGTSHSSTAVLKYADTWWFVSTKLQVSKSW